jgi:prevent-host-death family protein
MTVISVYDAKTHLPKLLDRVSRGERFLITKNGRSGKGRRSGPA